MIELKSLLKKVGIGGNKNGDEYVVGIVLKEEEGVGLLIKTSATTKMVELVETRKFKYHNSWAGLVYDIDELLFGLENQYSVSLKSAIFFVYSHFTDRLSGALKEPYASALGEIVKNNRLDSKGYIVYNEAIANFLKYSEQSPLSAIIVEVDNPAVSAFVYRGGNIIFSDTVAKTENIVNDLQEIFSKTGKDVTLPPRITMYDSSSLTEESRKILHHSWDEKLFIQLPKVEVIPDDSQYQALVAAYSQMEYATIPPLLAGAPVTDVVGQSTEEQAVEAESVDEPVEVDEPITEAEVGEPTDAHDDAEVEDIAEEREEIMNESMNDMSPQPAEVDGFLIGGDVREGAGAMPEEASYAVRTNPLPEVAPAAAQSGNNVKNFLSKMRFSMPTSRKKLMIPLGVVAAIGVIMFAVLYFAHKTTLTLYYESPAIKETLAVNDIAIHEQTKSFSAKATLETSGTKEIGEKAEGEVTIFNARTESRTLPKGTKLTATQGGLVFVLLEAVNVDAATSSVTEDDDVLITTSKKNAKVEAEKIGSDYNIGNDQKLTIDGTPESQMYARTNESFKGGTQKEVQTASKEDFAKIDKILEEKLTKQSEESMKKVHTKEVLIKELTEVNMSKKTYSKEIAEEATSLEAEAQATLSILTYDENEVKNQLVEKIGGDVPDGYRIISDNVKAKLTKASRDEETKKVNVTFEVTAQPELVIDQEKLLSSVKGKQSGQLQNILSSSFKVTAFKLEPQGNIGPLGNIMPFFGKNIMVKIEPI